MSYSIKYYRCSAGGTNTFDTRFKLKLNSLLTNVNKQLSLNLSLIFSLRIDINAIANVNALNLRGSRNVVNFSSLGRVRTLDIRKCDNAEFDFSVFGGDQNLLWLQAHDGNIFHIDTDNDDYDDENGDDHDDDKFYHMGMYGDDNSDDDDMDEYCSDCGGFH
jgi:hypothetical protein